MSRFVMLLATFIATAILASRFGVAAEPEKPAPRLDLYGDPLPPGAIARLGSMRFRVDGHWGRHLAVSADGETLIFAGEQSIAFFDAKSGKRLQQIETAPMAIRGCAISPDGKSVAAAGFWWSDGKAGEREVSGELRIYDAAMGGVVRTLARDARDVDYHALAFTPDGKLLVSLGTEGQIRIEEVETGVELLAEKVSGDIGMSLALSPDGETIAVCTGANTRQFFLWKWREGGALRELKPFRANQAYGVLTFSRDGERLAVALERADYPLQVWSVETGELLHRFGKADLGDDRPSAAFYPPDGKTLIAPSMAPREEFASAIHKWDAASGEYLGKTPIEGGGTFALSDDGRTLAAAHGTLLKVWNWPSGEAIDPIGDAQHFNSIYSLVATSRNEVVTGAMDGAIRVWDPATGKQKRVLRHDGRVCGVAVSPDGALLASSGMDDTVRLWNLEDGREIYRLPGHKRLGIVRRPVAFSADGASFSSFGDDMDLRTYDVKSGRAIGEHKIHPEGFEIGEEAPDPFGDGPRVECSALSADGSRLAISIRGLPILFDAVTGKELRRFEPSKGSLIAFALSDDHRLLLAGAWGAGADPNGEAPIVVWNTESGEIVSAVAVPRGAVRAAAFSRDGKRFAVSLQKPSRRIAIYDIATGEELQAFEDLASYVESLCFSHDGKSLISGMSDSTALVWELK